MKYTTVVLDTDYRSSRSKFKLLAIPSKGFRFRKRFKRSETILKRLKRNNKRKFKNHCE